MKGPPVEYSLARRKRKTVSIAVLPDGRVEVAAPLELSVDRIDGLVEKRSAWIRSKQAFFREFEPRRTSRRYIAGETHLLLGKGYRLQLTEGKAEVAIRGDHIVVSAQGASPSEVASRLDAWYRRQASRRFEEILDSAWRSFGYPDAGRPRICVRRLVRRWGSLSEKGTLTLNLSLIQAPKACIEYVIVHELCHIEHPGHGTAFTASLKKAMPDWEKRKTRLERFLS
jgi:predicted metal-dependent hydrolase